ncbi:rapamycin binding domain protein [Dictyocaulus viviparus]|uniref:Rapamycin binding domain protein n=1 Tax=Dictyocaulus viviparus TaxID=29172 RepID=A0A0D8X5G8_DICVI|nr:rapamycin binding domain protein [Dictyocaulus viviparus]
MVFKPVIDICFDVVSEKNTTTVVETLEPVHKIIEKGPTTLKEQSFNQTYYCELSDAYKFCQAIKRTENVKEPTQAWEIYCQVFKKITAQLRQLTSLDLNYISPMLMKAKVSCMIDNAFETVICFKRNKNATLSDS